jgi:hypothetical protein
MTTKSLSSHFAPTLPAQASEGFETGGAYANISNCTSSTWKISVKIMQMENTD